MLGIPYRILRTGMATRKGNFMSGSLGKISFRVVRGEQVMQSKPGKGRVRQTAATKTAAGIFGKASSLALSLRQGFKPLTGAHYDGLMISRFTGALKTIVNKCYDPERAAFQFNQEDFRSLEGFNFNLGSPLHKNLWKMPVTELSGDTLTLTIPAQQVPGELIFPRGTNLCVLKVAFFCFSLTAGTGPAGPQLQETPISAGQQQLEQQRFSFVLPEGCLGVAAVSLNYYKASGSTRTAYNHKLFHPAAICAAWYRPGDFPAADFSSWILNPKAIFNPPELQSLKKT